MCISLSWLGLPESTNVLQYCAHYQPVNFISAIFKMYSPLAAILTAAYTLQTVSAQTPPGFKPATSNHLTVTYGTAAVNPAGITVPGNGMFHSLIRAFFHTH